MKKRNGKSSFWIFCLVVLSVSFLLIACGDNAADDDVAKLPDDTNIQDLTDAEKNTFCTWYIENAGMNEEKTCTINEEETKMEAVTLADCLANLDSQPKCTVSAYKACAPEVKKDRCGFKMESCPALVECNPPKNDPVFCRDSNGECKTNKPSTYCMYRYEMNTTTCVALGIASLGIWHLKHGINCFTGAIKSCSQRPADICHRYYKDCDD